MRLLTMSVNRARHLVLWVLGAVILMGAGCSSTTHSSTTPTGLPSLIQGNHPIPQGWKTYKYRGAAISAPASWAVERKASCPDFSAPGTVIFGIPRIYSSCPSFSFTSIVVVASDQAIAGQGTGTDRASLKHAGFQPVTLNGDSMFERGYVTKTAGIWTGMWTLIAPQLGIGARGWADNKTKLGAEILGTIRRAQ